MRKQQTRAPWNKGTHKTAEFPYYNARHLWHLRRGTGESRATVARACGFGDEKIVERAEYGERCTPETLARLAAHYRRPLTELIINYPLRALARRNGNGASPPQRSPRA